MLILYGLRLVSVACVCSLHSGVLCRVWSLVLRPDRVWSLVLRPDRAIPRLYGHRVRVRPADRFDHVPSGQPDALLLASPLPSGGSGTRRQSPLRVLLPGAQPSSQVLRLG